MRLILTEKPSVAKDIAKAIGCTANRGSHYANGTTAITWAYGHLLEIDTERLTGGRGAPWKAEPILPSKFIHRPIKPAKGSGSSAVKQLKAIKSIITGADEVVIATDAGREGELIARLILEYCGWRGKTLRFWTSEALSTDAVVRAMSSLKPATAFDSLYSAASARAHGDWIVGINLTRAVTIASGSRRPISLGRVQTPTLAIIVDRDKERESFVPEPYAVLEATFECSGGTYTGTTQRMTRDTASDTLSKIKPAGKGRVESVETSRKTQAPPELHSLTTLQREANSELGLTAAATLQAAQALYETHKCLSYPRTDARHMGDNDRPTVEKALKAIGAGELLAGMNKAGKRVFDSSKLTDHHALIPLAPCPKSASKAEQGVWQLTEKRFRAAFMDDYIHDLAKVVTNIDTTKFNSQGTTVVQLGWKALYASDKDNKTQLPKLEKGTEVKVKTIKQQNKATQPPAEHTDSSVLEMMEKFGLGTPATRSGILETLAKRGYAERHGRALVSTPSGREIIERLSGIEIVSPQMTSLWEKRLEEIYTKNQGRQGYESFMQDIRSFVVNTHKQIMGMSFTTIKNERGNSMSDEPIAKCTCGGDVTERPKSYTCKACGATLWKETNGHAFSESDANEFFTAGATPYLDFTSKAGKPYRGRLVLKDGKAELEFENNGFKDKIIAECTCGGDVTERPKSYTCKACGATLWKETNGHAFSESDANEFFTAGATPYLDFTSKAGKPYRGRLVLKDGKAELEFENKR